MSGFLELDAERVGATQFDSLMGFQRHRLASHVGLDGQFPGAEVNQGGQYDTGWAAIIEDLIHRGADGPAAHDDIVNQDDVPTLGIEGQA